ncbi:MAG: TPM domain-containing protein, partial [Deltaproteobacteria bacterium]|nr:TPM domain-containing protein [Deltaproteobacteria bacterium]
TGEVSKYKLCFDDKKRDAQKKKGIYIACGYDCGQRDGMKYGKVKENLYKFLFPVEEQGEYKYCDLYAGKEAGDGSNQPKVHIAFYGWSYNNFYWTFVPAKQLPYTQVLDIPKFRGYVNDYADMISPSAEQELKKKLSAFEQQDSTQIVILTIPSLHGDAMDEFSLKVANKWKIGQRGKDNGILFVVSKQDKKMRIEVGKGLEARLPNPAVGKLINRIIKPKFSSGDFDGGFIAGASALIDATKGAYTAAAQHRAVTVNGH